MIRTKMRPSKLLLPGTLVLFALLVVACSTRIDTIRANPAEYAGRTVTVGGTLDRLFPLPLGEYRIAIISDESAAIPVLLSNEYQTGEAVRLRAEVVAFSVDGIRASRDDFERRVSHAVDSVGGDGETLARRIMNLLIPLAETFEITYLLIEQ